MNDHTPTPTPTPTPTVRGRRLITLTATAVVSAAALLVGLVMVQGTSKGRPYQAGPLSPPGSPGAPTRAGTSTTLAPPTSTGLASYRVTGNRIEDSTGRPVTPYGVTVYGLSEPGWEANVASDDAQIAAIAGPWHGNFVRIQVAPTNLLDASPYDTRFLNAVDQEVQVAESHSLDIILSAQYERTTKLAMPDQSTQAFWKIVASHYRDDQRIWLDLFNEPQMSVGQAGGIGTLWEIWQNGGDGYVGMQELVDTIRDTGAENIVLVEGVQGGKSLAGLPTHLLTGPDVAYAVHPYFDGPQWSSPSAWDTNWGSVSAQVPVVADEWGEYERRGGSCVPNAASLVPAFLAYLSVHDVGLIAWALIPGVLIRGDDFSQPTAFDPGVPYSCSQGDSTSPDAQGAGALVQAYFAAHSQPAG